MARTARAEKEIIIGTEAGSTTDHAAMLMIPLDLENEAFTRRRGPRRGSTLVGMLTTIGVLGAFAVVVYVAVPSGLHGGASDPPPTIAATFEQNQAIIDSLASLIGHSAQVIAVHPRTASPYVELVLRLHGDADVDEIPARELVVLSHSAVLHTVVLYELDDEEREGAAKASKLTYTLDELKQPTFCNHWRSDPDVRARLLARGISDMQIQQLESSFEDGTITLRLSLTWSPDSADGGDAAAVLIEAAGQQPVVHVVDGLRSDADRRLIENANGRRTNRH